MTSNPTIDLLEKDLQRNVRALAVQLGWKVHVQWTAVHSPRGWPDLSLFRGVDGGDGDGELVFIELKREKAKTTPFQDEWLAALATVPGVKFAGVIRPSDWYAGRVEQILR